MKAHQLDGEGRIINTIVVESLDVIPGLVDAVVGGKIGDIVVDGALNPLPVARVVPESVAMWQARAVLIEEGVLDGVLAFINTIGDDVERAKAQAKFEYSSTVRRDDPLVAYVIPVLGKSEDEIDQMFIDAAAL